MKPLRKLKLNVPYKMISVYLNIGSNKGDRHSNIERAVAQITEHPFFAKGRVRQSPEVYSAPMGYVSDAEFLNVGVAIDFADDILPGSPIEILNVTQEIEQTIAPNSPHRNSDGTYRDRIVDIDIIHIDGVVMETERLTLPHPRAAARRFVTEPMAFLAPHWRPTNAGSAFSAHNKKSIEDMARDSLEAFKMKNKAPIAIILDNIRSLNNVGSIFRTSDAFCVEHVALCGITATPPSSEIHKTALGAEESVDWTYYETTRQAVEKLRGDGYTIICLEQVHNSESLECFVPSREKKYAVVVGNEVSGVDQEIVDLSDLCVEIPQAGTKHSLNVSVSAAIALWHLFRGLAL